VASWSIQPFGHNRPGPKIGGRTLWERVSWVPIQHNVARAEAYLSAKFHLDPSNCLATVGLKLGWGCYAPFWGSWSPSNTMLPGPRPRPPYQMVSWSTQPFDHNRHGPRIIRKQAKSAPVNFISGGLLCPFPWGWELGPYLTQCGRDWGLPACQVLSWPIQPFGHSTPTSQTDRTIRQTTVR